MAHLARNKTPAPPATSYAMPEHTDEHRLTVMVVEDHDDTRFMLRWALETSGYRVVEAADGLEAVEIAKREKPDLILMDGTLPLLDGLDATRRIRQQALMNDVPILALSGHTTPDFQTAALAAGCNAIIAKPVVIDAMVKRIKNLLPQ
ncbi:MAG TPA: response regulator [Pyrinomonadaceae bacterium]|jgi:CheY-like chemotaxis protein